MKIDTERLILNAVNKFDNKEILALRSNKVVNRFIKRNIPTSIQDAEKFIDNIVEKTKNNECLYWVIRLKNNTKLIGSICLWKFSEDKKTAEVGYELLPEYHGKGMMSEALVSVLSYGFTELNLSEIVAHTHKDNESSKSLLLKHQFVFQEEKKDKNNLDNYIFSLNRLQYNI